MRRKTRLTWLALLMSMVIGVPTAALALEKVKIVIPQNSIFILNWMGARDAGVFRKHGIDLDVDARPFAGYLAGLPSKECVASTYAGLAAVMKMTQGLDVAVIGGGLTVIQDIFVLKDSPIKTVEDLRGKRFGVWSTGAGAFKSVRAALIDSNNIDLVKDTKIVQVAAPALYKMAERGQVDAMVNISSFTMKAFAGGKFRSIYSANEYWKKKTGYPVVWSAPLVAWKDWIEKNPKTAKNFAEAAAESYRWLRKPENFDAAVKKYGKLAGVTDADVVAIYKKYLAEKRVFMTEWSQKSAHAQWQFLEIAKKYGVLDKVPPEGEHALLMGN